MKIPSVLFLLLLSGLTMQTAQSKPSPYALEQRHVNPNNPEDIVVRVYNRQNGQTIWQKHFRALSRIAWSKDHTALALYLSRSNSEEKWPSAPKHIYSNTASPQGIELVIWQAGMTGLQVYRKWLYRPNWNAYDGVLDMRWSPHNRRLAVRLWGSGGWDLNVGQVWCLEPRTGQLRYAANGIKEMWWHSDRRLAYRKRKTGANGAPESLGVSDQVYYWVWQ
jgi:hypothetical protein